MKFLPALVAFSVSFSPVVSRASLDWSRDSTVLLYGNSLVERLCETGEMEASIRLAHPQSTLRFRSLAWTGDEVGYRLRPEGYVEHLKQLLERWPASVVIAGFGGGESFAGPAGLDEFSTQLEAYVDELQRLHPGARVVLLTPLACEGRSSPAGVDVPRRNEELAAYAQRVRKVGETFGAVVVDLFEESRRVFAAGDQALTVNGMHLNDAGSRQFGRWIASRLCGEEKLRGLDEGRVREVAKAVARKAAHNADLVRPKNAVVYFGVRKRPDEYAEEIPRYHQLLEAADRATQTLVGDPGARLAEEQFPALPPLPPGRSKADSVLGVIKPPAEQQKDLKVAEGFELNLFASEEQFPELRNPVQMAFDAKGRLWVVTMPSWPHTVPGERAQDKILILEDTDRDGKADQCTVFADGLDALDGIAFHERGVVVSAQPRLWVMQDTDGDGRADVRSELLRGVDVTDSHHGGMIAADPLGHIWFCDGVFHRSQIETPFGTVRGVDATTYRLDPRTGRVWSEWQSQTPNPWKMTFNRQGMPFQMYGDGLVLDGLQLTWTPLGAYHPFAHAKTLGYGKGSGAQTISSPNFPEEYQQGMASAALLGQYLVAISKYRADAGPFVASDRLDVLRSENPAFRPVDVAFGMDGGMYVADFCSKIIGHAQHPMRDPLWNHEFGRIWRVVSKQKPVVREWPQIEGASVDALLGLLRHPQDLVREHARIALRRAWAEAGPALEKWVAGLDRKEASFGQCMLEALWVCESKGEVRPAWLEEVLRDRDPLVRVAAVQLLRFQAAALPQLSQWLMEGAADPHPRVRMAVVNVVAHLRGAYPSLEHVLHGIESSSEPAVKGMLADLRFGLRPLKGRSVPILEADKQAQLRVWEASRGEKTEVYDVRSKWETKASGDGVYRTLVGVEEACTAVLSVRHGFLEVAVNGVPLLSTETMWASEQQAQLELKKGVNQIEVTFRKLRGAPPAVYLFDPLGRKLQGAQYSESPEGLAELKKTWDAAHAEEAGVIKVRAVPNQMQFSPKELRVKAGQSVRIVFENPDLMLHNWVLVRPGMLEEVGLLADKMAAGADGLAKGYVPESKEVLQSTALVGPNGRAELRFDAPKEPGRYPYLCTFPGHWRIMQGVLVVE
ncbi:MAG: hypothetical protein RLZZ142_534 [Verrucomicrobiota bacterium]